MVDLKGKVALVTGATSGIGTVTAEYLAEHGVQVILGVRNTDAGEKLAKEIMAKYPGSKVECGPPLDLMSQKSVKAFAQAILKRPGSLDILVNNAGLGFIQKSFTEEGVGMLTQVNHLGPFTLTRLLEPKLIASKARVVNVVSVTHRMAKITDVKALFTDWRHGFYQHNKLANVYTAFEMQRRLGARGVTVAAADPGAVRTNIYNNSPKLGKGFIKALIDNCYAPPEDGAQAVIYAATVDWDKDKPTKKDGSPVLPHEDLRYYARGIFAWPQVCNDWAAPAKGGLAGLKNQLWGANTAFLSFLDWPLRKALGSKGFMGKTKACRPGSHAYNEDIAKQLWEVSSEYAGVKS